MRKEQKNIEKLAYILMAIVSAVIILLFVLAML